MKIYIDQEIQNLKDLFNHTTVIDIVELHQYNMNDLLEIESLTIVASGIESAELVSQLINSRPNEKKPITLIQAHPNLTILLDQQGAQLIL